MSLVFSLGTARAHWYARQGLAGCGQGNELQILLRETGWLRTLGGVDAYLAAKARCPELSKASFDAAVGRGDARIVPAARGCMYLVPRDDVALALAWAQSISVKRTARDLEKAGIADAELEAVGTAVLGCLEKGEMKTAQLRSALPDGVVRRLGDLGKKVGISSTLPPALRRLEFAGAIERIPAGGSLDTEHYLWRAAHDPDIRDALRAPAPTAVLAQSLALRFIHFAAPVTAAHFVEWSGAGKRDTKVAISELLASGDIAAVEVEGWDEAAYVPADSAEALPIEESQVRLLAFEDNYLINHGAMAAVSDPADAGRPIRIWGRGKPGPLGEATHVAQRTIVVGGLVRGYWEFDPSRQEAIGGVFRPMPEAAASEARGQLSELTRFITSELGHARFFVQDKEEKIQLRANEVRELTPL